MGLNGEIDEDVNIFKNRIEQIDQNHLNSHKMQFLGPTNQVLYENLAMTLFGPILTGVGGRGMSFIFYRIICAGCFKIQFWRSF